MNLNSNNRRCGVCRVVGHTVRECDDVGAGVAVAELMSIRDVVEAVGFCARLPSRYVSFALCHVFGVSVSGGRPRLISLVRARLDVVPDAVVVSDAEPDVVSDADPEVVSDAAVVAEPAVVAEVVSDANAVEVVPVANAVAVAEDAAFLYSMLADETRRFQELITSLTAFRARNLREDVILLPGNASRSASMSDAELHSEIERLVVKVITRLIENFASVRASGAVDVDQHTHICNCVENMPFMNAVMNNVSSEGHMILSARAKQYIMTHIMIKICIRRYNVIRDAMLKCHVPDVMKALKIVVKCRMYEEEEADEVVLTCGVCFDDLTKGTAVRTGCGHNFCSDCICNWAKQRGIKSFIQCPCCRTEIDKLTVAGESEQVKVESGLAPAPVV